MIVLITNTIVPYCYDVAHVLGLPHSFSHRFRYRTRWIKLPYEIKEIKERKALVVLRNFLTGDFWAIRYVTIENVRSFGDINYIEFRLEGYAPKSIRDKTSERIGEILANKGFENKGGHELECLVLHTNEKLFEEPEENKEAKEYEDWAEILKEIGEFDCYKNFSFLKILHVEDSKGICEPRTLDDTGKFSFALHPGRLYFLDVIQHVPWEIDKTEFIENPYDVELKAETDEVVVLRKIQRVVGKYDLLRFIFKTPSGYTTRHTFVEVENKQSGESGKYGLPALFIPLCIKPTDWMKWVLYCRIFLGALAIAAIILSEPLSRVISIGSDWARTLALLVLVFAAGKWDEFVLALVKETKEMKIRQI